MGPVGNEPTLTRCKSSGITARPAGPAFFEHLISERIPPTKCADIENLDIVVGIDETDMLITKLRGESVAAQSSILSKLNGGLSTVKLSVKSIIMRNVIITSSLGELYVKGYSASGRPVRLLPMELALDVDQVMDLWLQKSLLEKLSLCSVLKRWIKRLTG